MSLSKTIGRRCLPPGIDEDQTIFGIMWIRVGALKFNKVVRKREPHSVVLQLWGEKTPSILQVQVGNLKGKKSLQQYDIHCPVTLFARYLLDMGDKIKLQIEGVGVVLLDIRKFLKENLTIESKTAFDHFKGFFEVVNSEAKKVGSLEVEMHCNFNPEIALRQLEEEEQEKDKKEEQCPVPDNLKSCPCQGTCNCKRKQGKQPEKVEELKQGRSVSQDLRLPNSLDTKQPQHPFNPAKYVEPQKPAPLQPFPLVNKVLTYSNLRLRQHEHSQQKQPANDIQHSNQKITIKAPIVINNVTPIATAISPQQNKQFVISSYKAQYFPHEHQLDNIIPHSHQQTIDQKLLDEFYGANQRPIQVKVKKIENSLSASDELKEGKQWKTDEKLSRVSEIRSEVVVDPPEILSRVVNLEAELEKARQRSRVKKLQQQLQHEPMERRTVPPKQISKQTQPKFIATMKSVQSMPRATLLLNLIIDIPTTTIKLHNKVNFVIYHKPYGQKERVKIGPNFGQRILIINPVAEAQILLMDRVPFILQLWNADNNRFIGIIKLDLKKIRKGFILEGKLNEIAIKTSLFPTIVHKGPMTIADLNGKGCGLCFLHAAIGTVSQSEAYLNHPSRKDEIDLNQIKQEQSQVNKQSKPEVPTVIIPLRKQVTQASLTDFTQFLRCIDESKAQVLPILLKFTNKATVTPGQFQSFQHQVGFEGHISSLLVYLGVVSSEQLTQSFRDYKDIKDSFISQFTQTSILLFRTLKGVQFAEKIKSKSEFKAISKDKLKSVLICGGNNESVSSYLSFFDEYVNCDVVIASLTGQQTNFVADKMVETVAGCLFLQNNFLARLNRSAIDCEIILKGLNKQAIVTVFELSNFLLRESKQRFSLWLIYHIFDIVKRYFDEPTGQLSEITLSLLYNWLKIKQKTFQLEKIRKEKQIVITTLQPEVIKTPSVPLTLNNLENVSQNSAGADSAKKQSLPLQTENKNEQLIKTISVPLSVDPSSGHNQQNSANKQNTHITRKLTKNQFQITVTQLTLQTCYSGDCFVLYTFPRQDEQISSKKITLFDDKHKYPVNLSGSHMFTIEQTLDSYLNDCCLKFKVVIAGRIQLEGDLHSDELVVAQNQKQTKIVPLFADGVEKIAGKVKIHVEYRVELVQGNQLGKETVYNVFLPKNGHLNFEVETQLEKNRIKDQLKIASESYFLLMLDLFHELPKLKQYFPATSSKLYADLNEPLKLYGTCKISLGPAVLQYFKTKTALLSLVVVYYSKGRGNFQRKQITIGDIRIPLLNLVREEGINGNYALKNNLGMLVSLAKAKISYDRIAKTVHTQSLNNSKGIEHNRENFWILLEFMQLINFDNEHLNHVRFQMINQGRKYATDKIILSDETYSQLNNSQLVMHLNQECFMNTKVLPINVVTNGNKLAIDINMKPVGRQLSKEKHYVHSQYFMVVDQHSAPRKMRVGIKISAFRGGIHLSDFIDSLQRIRGYDIFEQVDMTNESNAYPKMLQRLRTHLKLSTKYFQEVLLSLLSSKNKDKLCQDLFTNQIYYKLGLTPIIAQCEADIDFVCEELPTEVNALQLADYLRNNQIKLQNFRKEFLDRYTFKELNANRLDKNVEFLGLNNQVDLITFVRKLKIQQNQSITQDKQENLRLLKLTFLRGHNFEYLYNGIKPNVMLKVPAFDFETETLLRESQPVFDASCKEVFELTNAKQLRRIKVEIYHVRQGDNEEEPLLIGEGQLTIEDSLTSHKLPHSKLYKVILTSKMSSKTKASLQVKVQISLADQMQASQSREHTEPVQESEDASRIEMMLKRMNNSMGGKEELFHSSDEDE